MSINMIRVDEIRICCQCKGEGFVEHTDYNSLERVRSVSNATVPGY